MSRENINDFNVEKQVQFDILKNLFDIENFLLCIWADEDKTLLPFLIRRRLGGRFIFAVGILTSFDTFYVKNF